MPKLLFATMPSRAPISLPRWCLRLISLSDLHCRHIDNPSERAAGAIIAECSEKARRLLTALQSFRSFSRNRRKDAVRMALNARTLHVWALYQHLQQRGSVDAPTWPASRILEQAATIDFWAPLNGEVLCGFQQCRAGNGRHVYQLADAIDAARHYLAVAVLRAIDQPHAHMFSAKGSGGEPALKAFIRERLPSSAAVLTTDLPSCFASLSKARVEERLLLPKRVTKALLTEIKPRRGAGPSRYHRAHSNAWAGWEAYSDRSLKGSGSCAEVLEGEYGVLAGLPLAALAAEAVLAPVLTSIEEVSDGITAACWVDNLIVLLPRKEDAVPVQAAFAAALRDAVSGPALVETLRRIERRDRGKSINYLKFRISVNKHHVSFSPEHGFIDGIEQRLHERGGQFDNRITQYGLQQTLTAAFQRFDSEDAAGKLLQIYESVRELAAPDPAAIPDAPTDDAVLLYTDGACLGNPGPGGWAALILPAKHISPRRKPAQLFGSAAITTNNKMELVAVIEGLRCLPDGVHVLVFSDSKYVVDTATHHLRSWLAAGGYRPVGKRPKNWRLWLKLAHEIARLHVRFQWIKGHANDRWNATADRLARRAARDSATANRSALTDSESATSANF